MYRCESRGIAYGQYAPRARGGREGERPLYKYRYKYVPDSRQVSISTVCSIKAVIVTDITPLLPAHTERSLSLPRWKFMAEL